MNEIEKSIKFFIENDLEKKELRLFPSDTNDGFISIKQSELAKFIGAIIRQAQEWK